MKNTKRIITAILALLVLSTSLLALTGCTPETQEKHREEVVKYLQKYGDVEILSQKQAVFNTLSFFEVKDKTDGFTYHAVIQEVYASDLGYTNEQVGGQEKIYVTWDNFTDAYMTFLYSKIDKVKLLEYAERKLDGRETSNEFMFSYMNTPIAYVNEFSTTTNSFYMSMKEQDPTAIYGVAKLMQEVDTRGLLKYASVPVMYDNKEDIDSFSFNINRLTSKDERADISMLSEYVLGQNLKNVRVESIQDVKKEDVDVNGVKWLSDAGKVIRFTSDEKTYDFYTIYGVKEYTTSQNALGIRQGSYLSLVYPELTPNVYLNLALFGGTETEEGMNTMQNLYVHCVEVEVPEQ